MITPEDVKKVADLARIAVSDEELAGLTKDLESIVAFVDVVQSRAVEDASANLDRVNVFREDIVAPLDSAYNLVEAAPVHKDGFVSVPKVIE